MRAVKIVLLAIAGVIVAAFLVLVVADRVGQPPTPDSATLIAKAQQYDVRIKRDTYGVPHVIGPRDADVAFGLGFAQAEDDFATLQQVALATRGQLAATEGRKAAVADYLVHLLRVWETVNAKYDSDLPADVRQVLEAYADGVNYYAALHRDKVIALRPCTRFEPGRIPIFAQGCASRKRPPMRGHATPVANLPGDF